MPLSSCYLEIGHPRFYGLAAWAIGYWLFSLMQINLDYNVSCHENRPITLFWLFFSRVLFYSQGSIFSFKIASLGRVDR